MKAIFKNPVYTISYIFNNNVRVKSFADYDDAKAAYDKVADMLPDSPRKFENATCCVPVRLGSFSWTEKQEVALSDSAWRKDAKARLIDAKINDDDIAAVMALPAAELRDAVAGRDLDKLMEQGVGEFTARRICFALRSVCRATEIKSLGSREFIRVQLNNDDHSTEMIVDRIRKGVSPIEANAIALGGEDAIIHVVSWIVDPNADDLDGREWAEHLEEFWREKVYNGIVLDGVIYVPFGHGTNAAKECKTLWVKNGIYAQLKAFAKNNTSDAWRTTVAKRTAYEVGLQSVKRHSCGIPFRPEDVLVLDDVEDTMFVNAVKEFLDGHEENIDNGPVEVTRSDGIFFIDVPPVMEAELYNRMLARGDDPAEADRKLQAFMRDASTNSYRSAAALKGCGRKDFRFHEFLKDNGVTAAPDGRSLNTIAIILPKSVLKTQIGPNGAYPTFQAWCDAVGEDLDLGVCVKAHGPKKKNVSYQVVQSLCEASAETVRAMAQPTIDRVNKLHTISGAADAVGREIGTILRTMPTLANVRNIKERIERAIADGIDDAFGGKLLRACWYAFISPDPVYIFQRWFGLEPTGCLKAGQFHVGQVKLGKMATWRSPVMHPNSIRVVENVEIPKEYRKYFKGDEFVITMNSKDDIAVAMDADFDGDHGFVTSDPAIIKAAEETLSVWNRLVVWETPKADKICVTREAELEYFSGLTHQNELGLTVYGLNALLNRVIKRKDPVTGDTYTEVVPISKRGVNFKKFAANVLVDASKHGGATIDEPEESAQCKAMIQPWAKTYRDAAEAGEPREKLDKLARTDSLNRRHMVSTLNRLYALYSVKIDRSLAIHDAPKGEFDFRQLMFNPKEGYRGLSGIIRKGECKLVKMDGVQFRPDQGLFDSIARRIDVDRQAWQADKKDLEDASFEQTWRANAIAEIQTYAESLGGTLEDAYDVITWKMFTETDVIYATMDGSMDFIRDNLWKAYWLIFGGMAEEAALQSVSKDVFDTDELPEIA